MKGGHDPNPLGRMKVTTQPFAKKGDRAMSKNIIQLNEEAIKDELGTLVRNTVEETLNALLEQEADQLTNAKRYERTEDRVDTRAGHFERKLLT
jgi:putative transposase